MGAHDGDLACWAYIWALLTPVALMLIRRFPLERPRALRAVLLHGVAGLAFATLNLALRELHPMFSGDFVAVMADGARVPGSRRFRETLDALLR